MVSYLYFILARPSPQPLPSPSHRVLLSLLPTASCLPFHMSLCAHNNLPDSPAPRIYHSAFYHPPPHALSPYAMQLLTLLTLCPSMSFHTSASLFLHSACTFSSHSLPNPTCFITLSNIPCTYTSALFATCHSSLQSLSPHMHTQAPFVATICPSAPFLPPPHLDSPFMP